MGSTPNALLGQALAYADYGIPVFPVNWRKAPALEGGRGFKDASTDTKAIQLMFNKAGPKATGIGGYLGGVGMVGFDVDDKPESGKNGHADLELFEALHGEAIDRDTVTTVTPSGGRHYWYRMGDTPVGSRDGIEYEGRKTAIDIKGGLGYIVLPGSEGYEFLPGFDLFDGTAIAAIASWVPQYAPAARAGSGEPGGVIDLSKVDTWIKSHTATTTDPGLAADLERRCAELAQTSSRHPTLKSNLGWLIGQAGSGIAVDLPAAVERLRAALSENRQGHGEPRPTGKEVADLVAWTVTREANKYAGMIFNPPDDLAGEAFSAPDPEDPDGVNEEPESPTQRRADRLRLKMRTGAALLATPAPEPLVDGVLFKETTSMLVAPPKSGKTFLALDLAAAVVTGRPWQGFTTYGNGAPVVYMAGEGHRGLVRRLQAWCAHHSLDVDQVAEQLHVLPGGLSLQDEDDRLAVLDVLAEIRPVLVVIDTLHRHARGAEENSAKEMGRFVESIDAIAASTGAHVLVPHHSGKDTTKGARGSSALLGAVDTELTVTGAPPAGMVKVTEQRDAARAAPWHVQYVPAGIGPDGGHLSLVALPCAVAPPVDSTRADEVLEVLDGIDDGTGVSAGDWCSAVEQDLGVKRSSFQRDKKVLIEDGVVINIGTEGRPRYHRAGAEQGLL